MTFEGKAKWFWSKTSYIELIALYVHQKNSNHLRSHSRAIMALDHSKLGLESKFLKKKSGRIFCFRQVYLIYKILPTNLGCLIQSFILFIHHIWGETVLWGAVFIIQTLDRMQYFTIFQGKLHSVNIQDDQPWAFSETVQKISKITYAAMPILIFDKFIVRAVVECLNGHK